MNKNIQGFTLIELIVTLAVVSILLLTGIPMISGIIDNNRFATQINSISFSLSLARSESIKRGMSITLCGTSDGATCNSINWENGWLVFSDVNNNATLESATDNMLKIVGPLAGGSTLRLSRSDSAGIIRYKSDGALRDQNADATYTDRATFTLCDQNATVATAKAININPLGRVSRAEDTTDAGTIVNDVTGVDITCP